MNHPSELALERHLQDPQRSDAASHIAGCGACRARVQQMEEEGEKFRRFVYPATLENVVKPRRVSLRLAWLLAPAAGLAAVLLVARTGPSSDYIGSKGAPLELTAYLSSRALSEGETVPADAALRFRVRSARECPLLVFSVDGRGEVSRLYSQDVKGDVTLPGGVRLDGRAGPERFFAVCGASYENVVKAARSLDPDRLRHAAALPDVSSPQSSILLEKKP